MTDEGMDYRYNKLKSGYIGQRYEVRFDDEGKERVFGWTGRADGEPFVSSLKHHPTWKNPRVIDLSGTCVYCGCTDSTPCMIPGRRAGASHARKLASPCAWHNPAQTVCTARSCLDSFLADIHASHGGPHA